MKSYLSKALRYKRVFRVLPSNGAVEDESRMLEIDAYSGKEALAKYRRLMGGSVHKLEMIRAYKLEN